MATNLTLDNIDSQIYNPPMWAITAASIAVGIAVGLLLGSIFIISLREVAKGKKRIEELWKIVAYFGGSEAAGPVWLLAGPYQLYYYLITVAGVFIIMSVLGLIFWWKMWSN